MKPREPAREWRVAAVRRSFAGRGAALALSLTLVLGSLPARADPPADSAPPAPPAADGGRAAELKKSGDVAMEALRYADALEAYASAYAITANPALLYNMGRALQALNRYPEALSKLEAFDAAAPAELKKRVPRLPLLIGELRAKVATLTIQSNAEGARILVRGTVVGKAPLPGPLKLISGKADIEIEAEGYFPFKQTVDLPGGGSMVVEAKLFSRATTGMLVVRASATRSEVLIDGKSVGLAPVETILPGGAHRITVKNPDFATYNTSIALTAGERKDVMVPLSPPSIATRWWFWSGIGVVAAGGVALTIALLTERSPDAGDIPPGQVTASAARLRGRGAIAVGVALPVFTF